MIKNFKINNHKWNVEIKPEQELLTEYWKRQPNAYGCMGLTFYKEHKIWIASELCDDENIQQKRSSKKWCFITTSE